MTRISRYGKRMAVTFFVMVLVTCGVCFIFTPFITRHMLNNEVGYYAVVINGEIIGSANSENDAQIALADARLALSKQYKSYIYMRPDIKIIKGKRTIATRMSREELKDAIYSYLFDYVEDINIPVSYTLRIGDYTFTFESRDDIAKLIGMLAEDYDIYGQFTPDFVSDDITGSVYNIRMVENNSGITDANIVGAILGANTGSQGDDPNSSSDMTQDIITGISFEQEMLVIETSARDIEYSTVDEAYEILTQPVVEQGIYIAKVGDSVESVAKEYKMTVEELLALNEGYTEQSLFISGDEIKVNELRKPINVITTREISYEEDYEAEPEYVDDDESNFGENSIIEAGTTGKHAVTAKVTYRNGKEIMRSFVKETVIVAAKSATVAVGTKAQSDFKRPITGGTFSEAYGVYGDKFNDGVVWTVDDETSVCAAKDGIVTRAGWYSDYGYCVDVTHDDGSMTRYGHLGVISVKEGQRLAQGQKLGIAGDTGNTENVCLLFEIWIDGTSVNPLMYVNKN
ncbi:MAG: peptidoglycan DD-metalloendopeptidase family protein [Lachnospira sp.]